MTKTILFLIPLLIQMESGGNDKAIGDNGKALGCLQIHSSAWQDACDYLGVSIPYTKENAFNRKTSIRICKAYLERWGKHYEKVTGKKVSPRILAIIWNGGPNAWKSSHKYHEKAVKYANTLIERAKR